MTQVITVGGITKTIATEVSLVTVSATQIDTVTVSNVVETLFKVATVLETVLSLTTAVPIFKRAVEGETTVRPSNVPAYASACSGTARYSSACSCAGVSLAFALDPIKKSPVIYLQRYALQTAGSYLRR